jgi:PAS domain-containing protein
MKLSPIVALILSLILALVVTFIIDPLDPSTLSTPFCLGLVLMALSIRQPTWVMVIVSICYCTLVLFAMVHFLENSTQPQAPHPFFWFFQRFGLFLVVSVMAIYLSYYREETHRNLTHIQEILGKLPAPVAISDAAGYITYVNEALCTFFNKPASSLMGKRYVDFFMTNTQEGKAMRYYIELFADEVKTVHDVELRTSVNPVDICACLTCLGPGSQRHMITVLNPS